MITVVTAPSRSGTSLTMQMLLNAGVPVLWNCLPNRTPINPRGHYELKGDDISAFVSAVGPQEQAALKVMPWRLDRLPSRGYQYIVLLRDVDECRASHDSIKENLDWGLYDTNDIAHWRQFALDHVAKSRHTVITFDELFTGRGPEKIGALLRLTPLQVSKMKDCVDNSLRHFKGGK